MESSNTLPRALAVLALATLTVIGCRAELVFHVAPDGNDTNPGTSAKPFATLTRAKDAARQTSEPRRIVLHDGAYFDVALTLGAEDSGLTIEAAKGHKPVLYGGRRIADWQPDGERYIAAQLPANWPAATASTDSRNSDGGIRLLLVNGSARPRARFPNEGTLTHLTAFDVPWMSSTGGGWKRKPTHDELTTLKYRAGDVPAGLDVRNAEVTVFHMWDESCIGLAAHDAASQTLKFATPSGHPPGAFGVKKFVIWNTREGMTAPGQWYHDRSRNRIVYWPLPNEDPRKLDVIAPTATTILRIKGSREKPARDITFRGIEFSVTSVPLVAGGFAAANFDGAISLENAANCRFESVRVANVAGHGINTRGDAEGTRVENSEITGCGAGGLYVGGTGAVIRGNHVHRVGVAYPSAIGIFRGGKGNLVANNEVHDTPYSAINYGGVSNIIEGNLLYDCMKVLHDGAAIYMFAARDCVLRGNVARDIVDTGGYGSSAYYLDERSTGCVVENNLSVRVARPMHHHMATNNVVRNNVFIVDGDARLTFPRCADFTMERNILYATGKVRIENVGGVTNWTKNLFHSGAGKIESVAMKDYSSKETTAAAPGDTTVADPLFVDVAKGDYRFKPGSPALKLGIRTTDWTRAGR